jgi:hypothetical protein
MAPSAAARTPGRGGTHVADRPTRVRAARAPHQRVRSASITLKANREDLVDLEERHAAPWPTPIRPRAGAGRGWAPCAACPAAGWTVPATREGRRQRATGHQGREAGVFRRCPETRSVAASRSVTRPVGAHVPAVAVVPDVLSSIAVNCRSAGLHPPQARTAAPCPTGRASAQRLAQDHARASQICESAPDSLSSSASRCAPALTVLFGL